VVKAAVDRGAAQGARRLMPSRRETEPTWRPKMRRRN
jgi:hypothetical protein